MALDIRLLRAATSKKDIAKLAQVLPRTAIDEQTLVIFEAFERYFEKYKKHKRIDWATFIPMFYNQLHPHMSETDQVLYNATFKSAMRKIDDDVREVLMEDMQTLRLATQVAAIAERYNNGDDIDLPYAIRSAHDAWKLGTGSREQAHNDTAIEELLDATLDEHGVQWRLECLRQSMKPLVPGHFGLVAARPDAGKTSFLASEASYIAPQLDGPVCWFNNEGTSREIIPRIWQAALNCTIDELIAYRKDGSLRDRYLEIVGAVDKIRVYDIHGWSISQIEVVIEQEQPGLVIYDMLDNVTSPIGAGETRVDQRLEGLYKRAREMCVIHNTIGLATSQISGDGDGELFPRLHMLKESKTAKQGACDFAIYIGSSALEGMGQIRGIGCPKNKLSRPGAPKDPHCEVRFDYLRSRYSMPSDDEAAIMRAMENDA